MQRTIDFHRPWYSKAINLLPSKIDGRIVELGSGNGELAELTKGRIINLTLVDINRGQNIIPADFNRPLPFHSSEFSGAISLEVIEHLAQSELFLKEIYRVLKPKGWLIISTPNIAWWGYRLFMLCGQPPKKEGYHLRFFTHHTFSQQLKIAGFRVKKSASFTTIPGLNRLLIWLKFNPIYPCINYWPNFLAQDLVFLCRKK
ncbi:MAG: class I SAM-dependent methyltransferase [Patescibacteria group bacterium]